MAETEKNIHTGHRKRVKNSVLTNGIDGLNDHQVLEILLFYSIPNGDTNPIAHRLINRFGSLRGVLEADYDELCEVVGISENSASLIKFFQCLSGRYLRSACFEGDKEIFNDTDILRQYYESVFLGVAEEEVRALVLDRNLNMVAEAKILDGTVGKVQLSARKVADFVLRNKCDIVILAHNHPNSVSMPSKSDLVATKELYELLSDLEINLIDHIIVGKDGSVSLRASIHANGIWKNNM